MIKLTNQKQILAGMNEKDRQLKTLEAFMSVSYPTVWLWLFLAASYKLADLGHPMWGLVVLLASSIGVFRYILLMSRTIVAIREYLRQLDEKDNKE